MKRSVFPRTRAVADLKDGSGAPLLFWVKKEEITKGRNAGWASKVKPAPLLSSKSGFATNVYYTIKEDFHFAFLLDSDR